MFAGPGEICYHEMKMERPGYQPSPMALARMQVVHFGRIAFNWAVALLIVTVLAWISVFLSLVGTMAYYVLLVAATIVTLGMLFLWDGFGNLWQTEWVADLAQWLGKCWHYTLPVVIGCALVAVVCLCLDRQQKHPARITVAVVMTIVSAAILLIFNGGAA